MTKILWITNILLPEAVNILTDRNTHSEGSGGWILSSASYVSSLSNIQLILAAPCPFVKDLNKVSGEKITYYALPCKDERKYHTTFEEMWRQIFEREKPELVHIHGTEFSHGLAFLRAHIEVPTVLSIQGLSEEIGYHFLDGISCKDVYENISLFDLLYAGSLYKQQRRYIKHGKNIEREMIQSVRHIIGRTFFDYSHIKALNPEVIYHECNESLRDVFYDDTYWDYDSCNKHSIFLSQANYSIKGLHQVLKAMPLILKQYPDTTIRIAGYDITAYKTIKQKLMRTTYAKFISRLIKQLSLSDRIYFTGPLNAEQMRREYLRCNVFIIPSSIENSPNSLGEAQILGVPCVCSYVGGIPDMIPNSNCGLLYRYSDTVILAESIIRIFSSVWRSDEERAVANIRHNRVLNNQRLLEIYNSIIEKG